MRIMTCKKKTWEEQNNIEMDKFESNFGWQWKRFGQTFLRLS